MPNESDKRHIGYAIFDSGWKLLMTEQEVFVHGKGWTPASRLAWGDRVEIAMQEPGDMVIDFSVVAEVMDS